MATCESVSVVLKIKRKRTGEDPSDTLVVGSKFQKLDKYSEANFNGMFYFCGSYSRTDEDDDQTVLDIVKNFQKGKRPVNIKNNVFSKLSLSDSKEHTRSEKKKASEQSRYKILSSLRSLTAVTTDKEPEAMSIYLSELSDEGKESMESNTLLQEQSNSITCNSTILEREKIRNDDFAYDVYMSSECNMETVSAFDWTTLSVYETEFVHDIIESDDDHYEDEDDSNDESNWRNEYPEEESSCNSSVDSTENQVLSYRHREAYYDEIDYQDPSYDSENDDILFK